MTVGECIIIPVSNEYITLPYKYIQQSSFSASGSGLTVAQPGDYWVPQIGKRNGNDIDSEYPYMEGTTTTTTWGIGPLTSIPYPSSHVDGTCNIEYLSIFNSFLGEQLTKKFTITASYTSGKLIFTPYGAGGGGNNWNKIVITKITF